MTEPTVMAGMVFTRHGQRWFVHARSLCGVVPRPSITPVVQAPHCVLGLMSFRSEPLPVIEPSVDPPVTAQLSCAATIIVRSVGGLLALVADLVDGWVVSVPPPAKPDLLILDPDRVYRMRRAEVKPRR